MVVYGSKTVSGSRMIVCRLKFFKITSLIFPATPPANSRAYLDVEFFGHENIGDIKAVPLNAILNGGVLTPIV